MMSSITVDLQVSADSRWPWNGPGLSVGSSSAGILVSGLPTDDSPHERLSEHITDCLGIPKHSQRLQAPRFEELEESQVMEFVRHDINRGKWFHLDADSLTISRETDELIDLPDDAPVRILDKHTVHLTIRPSPLPSETGGRIFISYDKKAKQLVLPFVKPTVRIGELKARIERSLGVFPECQKLMLGWRELYDDEATVAESGLVENSVLVLETKASDCADAKTKPYKIFVSVLDGSRIELHVRGCDRVGFVKERIQDLKGTPVSDQQIKFRGKQLDDHRQLKDCGVIKEQTLHLMLKLRMVAGKQAAAGDVLKLVVLRDGKQIDTVEVRFKDTDTVADVTLRLRAQFARSSASGGLNRGVSEGTGGPNEYEALQREYQRMVEEMARMQAQLSNRGGGLAGAGPPQPVAGPSGGTHRGDSLSGSVARGNCLPGSDARDENHRSEPDERAALRKMEYPPGWKPIFATGESNGPHLSSAMSDPVMLTGLIDGVRNRPTGSPSTPLEFEKVAGAVGGDDRSLPDVASARSSVSGIGNSDSWDQPLSRPSTAPSAVSFQSGPVVDSILRKYLQEASIADLD